MSDNTDSIVARCGGCKRIVFVAVNEPGVMNPERYRAIGEMISEGCSVEHTTVEDVRKAEFGCKCESLKAQEQAEWNALRQL